MFDAVKSLKKLEKDLLFTLKMIRDNLA